MADGLTPTVPGGAADGSGSWHKARAALGPPLIGLACGGLVAVLVTVSSPDAAALQRNCQTAAAKFPGLAPRWFALDVEPPGWLVPLLAVLAAVLPVGLGLLTARLTRPRDSWAGLSAGLTSGAWAALAALALGGAWVFTLAGVVVPSIDDLTLLTEAAGGKGPRTERVAQAGTRPPPAELLAAAYPALRQVAADERANRVFDKILVEQVANSSIASAVAVVLLLGASLAASVCGTVAAGYILRRGDRLVRLLWPYVELTLPTSAAAAILFGLALRLGLSWGGVEGMADAPLLRSAASLRLVALAPLAVLAVVRRWGAFPRFMLAVSWASLLSQSLGGPRPPFYCGEICWAATALLLLRCWLADRHQSVPAAAGA